MCLSWADKTSILPGRSLSTDIPKEDASVYVHVIWKLAAKWLAFLIWFLKSIEKKKMSKSPGKSGKEESIYLWIADLFFLKLLSRRDLSTREHLTDNQQINIITAVNETNLRRLDGLSWTYWQTLYLSNARQGWSTSVHTVHHSIVK